MTLGFSTKEYIRLEVLLLHIHHEASDFTWLVLEMDGSGPIDTLKCNMLYDAYQQINVQNPLGPLNFDQLIRHCESWYQLLDVRLRAFKPGAEITIDLIDGYTWTITSTNETILLRLKSFFQTKHPIDLTLT